MTHFDGQGLQVVDLILEEFRKLKQEPLTEEELTRAKDQVKGNILMGLEELECAYGQSGAPGDDFPESSPVEEIIAAWAS